MTPIEFIEKEYGHAWLKYDWSSGDVIDALEEYAKYCAEQALLYFNGNEVGHIEVNEWWSEFQRKEGTE